MNTVSETLSHNVATSCRTSSFLLCPAWYCSRSRRLPPGTSAEFEAASSSAATRVSACREGRTGQGRAMVKHRQISVRITEVTTPAVLGAACPPPACCKGLLVTSPLPASSPSRRVVVTRPNPCKPPSLRTPHRAPPSTSPQANHPLGCEARGASARSLAFGSGCSQRHPDPPVPFAELVLTPHATRTFPSVRQGLRELPTAPGCPTCITAAPLHPGRCKPRVTMGWGSTCQQRRRKHSPAREGTAGARSRSWGPLLEPSKQQGLFSASSTPLNFRHAPVVWGEQG